MTIPKIISKNGHEYILVKEYKNFILYKDMLTESKECFSRQELGLIEKQKRIYNISPNKMKRWGGTYDKRRFEEL